MTYAMLEEKNIVTAKLDYASFSVLRYETNISNCFVIQKFQRENFVAYIVQINKNLCCV